MLQSVEEAAVARIVVFDSFDELVQQSSEATVLNIEETLQTIWKKILYLSNRWSFSLCNHDYDQVGVKELLYALREYKLFCL